MKKTFSCIMSILPLIGIILSVGFAVVCLFVAEGVMSTGEVIVAIFFLALTLLSVVGTFAVMIWFMVKACKNPNLSTGMKVLWCVLLYCFNVFVFPIFWLVVIRKEE